MRVRSPAASSSSTLSDARCCPRRRPTSPQNRGEENATDVRTVTVAVRFVSTEEQKFLRHLASQLSSCHYTESSEAYAFVTFELNSLDSLPPSVFD